MTDILIWNARGIREKRPELTKRIRDYIFAITESKIDNNYIFNISGYSSIRLDSTNNRSGGIIIFIKKELDYKILDCRSILNNNNSCDVAGISIDKLDLDLIIVYRRPYGTTPKHIWNKLGKLGTARKNTIIAGDFNSHHTMWNCEHIDANGENLLLSMYNHNFFCVNSDTRSHINNPQERASNIDLIFVSTPAINLVEHRQINDSGFGPFPPPYHLQKRNRLL